jgi:hypothetical protein
VPYDPDNIHDCEGVKAHIASCSLLPRDGLENSFMNTVIYKIAVPNGWLHSSPGRNKYHAETVTVDGITFRSKIEARRYRDLRLRECAGEISGLEYEPESYPLVVNGVKVTSYRPDFRYVDDGVLIVEDVKSTATARARDWPIRKKLMLAIHGITVREWPERQSRARRNRPGSCVGEC